MKATLKMVLGWDQRTEAEKAAFRRRLYQPLVALGLYLGSRVISLFPSPLWFKRNLAWLYVKKAELDLGSGANSAAMQAAKHAVALYPDVPEGYYVMGNIMFPGETYIDLLRRFHDWLRPKSYIEIGVSRGASIVLARPPTTAVGIDPEPRLLNAPKTVCKIFPFTSDDYFATRDPHRDIEAKTADLALIDGLHLFEQALRDFINIEKISSPTTLVLIHDCFAFDALTAEREPSTIFWTGDVWKIIPCLREFRPDLDVFTIATWPSGLGVVSRLNSRSTVLVDRFNEIVSRYISLEVDPDDERRKECAAMVANNWPEIVSRLSMHGLGTPTSR
jgi:Methyltransferase domain